MKLKKLVLKKVELSMKEFNEQSPMDALAPLPNVENVNFCVLSKRILDRLEEFTG